MGTSLCSASPVSEPNLPPDSTNQPTFLLPNLIRHPTELFSFNFLSQKNIQNLRSKMASRCRQNYHEECEAAINKQINMNCLLATAIRFWPPTLLEMMFT